MGDTLTTDVVDMSLTVRLDGLQRPAELVLIRSGEEVERRSLAAGDHAEAYDVPLPAGEDGFVRVELRQPSGEAFVLSNPIWILRPGGEAGR